MLVSSFVLVCSFQHSCDFLCTLTVFFPSMTMIFCFSKPDLSFLLSSNFMLHFVSLEFLGTSYVQINPFDCPEFWSRALGSCFWVVTETQLIQKTRNARRGTMKTRRCIKKLTIRKMLDQKNIPKGAHWMNLNALVLFYMVTSRELIDKWHQMTLKYKHMHVNYIDKYKFARSPFSSQVHAMNPSASRATRAALLVFMSRRQWFCLCWWKQRVGVFVAVVKTPVLFYFTTTRRHEDPLMLR